jgi:spore maturation protein CgeB
MPDREERVEEFFLRAASLIPNRKFILGGSGWENKELPRNVRYIGHVYTKDHNAFNCTPLAVLNVNRASMARFGFSPPTRIFEAAGAGAAIITDVWEGIEAFLVPDEEILVAKNAEEVANRVEELSPQESKSIGRAAQAKVLARHTYRHRAIQFQMEIGR